MQNLNSFRVEGSKFFYVRPPKACRDNNRLGLRFCSRGKYFYPLLDPWDKPYSDKLDVVVPKRGRKGGRPAGSAMACRSVGGMRGGLSLSLTHSLSYTYKAASPRLPPSAHRRAAIAGGGSDGLFSEWRLGRTRRVGELELEERERERERRERREARP